MKKLATAAGGVLAFTLVGPALADGPSGSHEEDVVNRCIDNTTGQEVPRNADGTCPDGSTDTPFTVYDNQVTCTGGEDVGGLFVLYAAENGVEICNGDSGLPIQGRLMVSNEGYVAADGDADNAAEGQGWIRVDGSGVRCGDAAGNRDATHPGAEDGPDDCGPQQ